MAFTTGIRRLHLVLATLTSIWAMVFVLGAFFWRNASAVTNSAEEIVFWIVIGGLPAAVYWVVAWVVSGFIKPG